MPGKKRSGFANDRRAYQYSIITAPSLVDPCGVINIASIAIEDPSGNIYILNDNYTITACQILNIPVGTTLIVSAGQTLTNNGIINNSGYIYNNNGIIQNNGTINNSSYLYNQTSGIFNNSGTFNNSGYLYNSNDGGGGTINNNTGGFIYTYGSGAIYNNPGGTINNNTGGFIYTYGGGNIFNDGGATINNNTGGTISTADGSSTCGTGTISGIGTFTGVIPTNTNCPS